MSSIMKLAIVSLGSGLAGAALLWIFQGHSLRIIPGEMQYHDFVAVLLTVLSALVAVVGLALAIFGLWGWTQFKKGVETKITEITPSLLASELQTGNTRRVLDDLVIDFFRAEMAKPGVAAAWATERDRNRDELAELDDAPTESEK
jgi:hypothetical protein